MASPFSFHCMICFEEFDTENRFPVVLPCGHTYVCNQCADRLDKCMECRMSLVQLIPRGGPQINQNQSNMHSRASAARWSRSSNQGGHHSPQTPPQPSIKKRLPLPKNVVLMSLIEATELAAENVRGQEQEPSLTESPMMMNPSILDIEDDEEEKIKKGTTLAISDCGTYAVSAREGLEIFPSRPEAAFQSGHEESEQDVDTLVRFFHMEHKLEPHNRDQDEKMDDMETKGAPPVKLTPGDRVQIVSTESGWAKLARGYGYVRAGPQQLVKVGGSVDRACKLEALLRLLSARRKELKAEQKRVDNQFISLMNELQVSLSSDEDLTVIAAHTFQKPSGVDENSQDAAAAASVAAAAAAAAEVRDNESSGHGLGKDVRSEDTTPLKPRPMARQIERPMTPPGETSRGYFCAGTDVFDAVIPLSGGGSRQPPALPSTHSPALTEMINQILPTNSIEATPTSSRMLASGPHPSPGALRAGAREWREMNGRQPSAQASLGIDFRTGMSGHSALTSCSSHPHDFLGPRLSLWGGMSNHTGLTLWKKVGKKPPQQSSNLNMPNFPSDSSTSSSPTTRSS